MPLAAPQRILYTIPNFTTAGSGRAMLNIMERLDRSRFAPAVCVSKEGGPLFDYVRQLGIPLIVSPFTVPAHPLATLPLRAWRCSRTFRPHRFDIWHSFHYLDDYTEPLIARLSGARAWVYTKKNMNWWRRSWRLRTWLASGVAAQNSTMMSDFFGTRRFQSKTRLVPPGVDHESYHPAVEPRLQLRERYGIPQGAIVAGIIAHLVPVKGHDTLLRAAAQVPDLVLFFAGRPDDRAYADSLHALARELNVAARTYFLGGISDVPALLRELDIFVLSTNSRGEGCPVALLEAMSAGLASIASNVPGSKDVIQSGRNGLLVPAEEPQALAEALSELAGDQGLRLQLGAAARQGIELGYTLAGEAAAYDALYQQALAS